MTTLSDIIPPLWLEHGLGKEEPKRTFPGWSYFNGKDQALGLAEYSHKNVMFMAGYYDEMADCAFVVERMRNA